MSITTIFYTAVRRSPTRPTILSVGASIGVVAAGALRGRPAVPSKMWNTATSSESSCQDQMTNPR